MNSTKLIFFAVLVFSSSCTLRPDYKPSQLSRIDTSYDFIVMGDNRPYVSKLDNFLIGASRFDTEKVIHLGDMIEFNSPLGFLSILEVLEEALRSDITFIPVVGNHDVDGSKGNSLPNLRLFNYYFDIDLDNKGYRYFEDDNNLYMILNSYYPGDENEIGDEQKTWFSTTLDELNTSKNILVFSHHPFYPAGKHDPVVNRDDMHALFSSYNVTAVFNAHEHLYYHTQVDDIHYYVTGGCGSILHESEYGTAIHHMLGVTSSPNFRVDILDENGRVITL
jgi:hypothetical protein